MNHGGERHVPGQAEAPASQQELEQQCPPIRMWSGTFPSRLMDDTGRLLPASYLFLKLWELWLLAF